MIHVFHITRLSKARPQSSPTSRNGWTTSRKSKHTWKVSRATGILPSITHTLITARNVFVHAQPLFTHVRCVFTHAARASPRCLCAHVQIVHCDSFTPCRWVQPQTLSIFSASYLRLDTKDVQRLSSPEMSFRPCVRPCSTESVIHEQWILTRRVQNGRRPTNHSDVYLF